MELSDKNAILLVVQALPTADVWREISQEEVIAIFKQAGRELARLESVELSSGLTPREPDSSKAGVLSLPESVKVENALPA